MAAYIREPCDGKKTVAQLVNDLCGEFCVDEATAMRDTIELKKKMNTKNLLTFNNTRLSKIVSCARLAENV